VILQQLLENKGLHFILNDTLSAIDAQEGKVSGISMKSGQRLDVQTVIVSAGIRGRDSLARQIGAQIDKGIVVNDAMQTTVQDVFAAGDPVEHRGMLYGIWPAAKEQGAAAGSNMAGKPLAYTSTFLSSNLKITGIDVYSAGDYNSPSDDLIYSIQAGSYKKYLIQGSKLAAAMVIGDAQEAKLASLVYQGKAALPELSQNSSQPLSTDKYECTTCGHIYDPAEGDPEHGIPKGTPFENLPEDWVCPLCSMGKGAFQKAS
jgi:nitrite reductase (NADH) large subunit